MSAQLPSLLPQLGSVACGRPIHEALGLSFKRASPAKREDVQWTEARCNKQIVLPPPRSTPNEWWEQAVTIKKCNRILREATRAKHAERAKGEDEWKLPPLVVEPLVISQPSKKRTAKSRRKDVRVSSGLNPQSGLKPRPFGMEDWKATETFIVNWDSIFNSRDITGVRGKRECQRGTVEKVNALIDSGKRVLFSTDDSSISRITYASRLQELGIRLPGDIEDNIISVGYTCGLYLKAREVRRPFVLTSSEEFLDDLRDAGAQRLFSPLGETGETRVEFQQRLTAQSLDQILKESREVDSVVIGCDPELNNLKSAVVAKFCLGRSRMPTPPVVTCCNPDFLTKLQIRSNSTMSRACGCRFNPQSRVDARMASEAFREVLQLPKGAGYGVDITRAVLITGDFDTDVMFANESSLKCLLVLGSSVHIVDESFELEDHELPDWVLPCFADL